MNNHKKIDWLRWHKRKYFIRINCAIMCAILLIILLFMFPVVSDASTFLIKDKYYCNEFYNVDTGKGLYPQVTDDNFWSWAFVSNPDSYYDNVKDLFDCTFDDRGSSLSPYLIFADKNDSDKLHFVMAPFGISFNHSYFGGYNLGVQYDSLDDYVYSISNNSLTYQLLNGTTLNNCFGGIITGFGSINFSKTNENGGTDFNLNVNYLASQNKCGYADGSNNGFNVPDPDTSIEDNMFLYGGGVALSSSTFKDGTLYICALPTNTQVNDNYKIIVDVNGFVSVTPDSLFSLLFNGYSMSRMYGIVAGQTNSRQFSGQIEIPFSDFTNGVATVELGTIYSECHVNGYDSDFLKLAEFITTNSNGWNLAYAPFYNYVVGAKSFGIKDFSLSLPAFLNPIDEQNKFNINGATVTFNMYVSNSDGSKTSEGSYTFTHDFITGRSNSVDNITKTPDEVADSTNDNDYINYEPSMPFIPNDSPQQPSYQNPLVPSNNTDNSSSNSNVINNPQSNSINNNISITQSNKYPEKGVMQSFVRIINNDKNNTVNDIDTMIGGNAYIQLCNHALSSVPVQVWNLWITCLKAILGILVSAFFLKILINWST